MSEQNLALIEDEMSVAEQELDEAQRRVIELAVQVHTLDRQLDALLAASSAAAVRQGAANGTPGGTT
jgi:phage shock protein A